MGSVLFYLMDLDPREQRAVDRGACSWPKGHELPDGWRFGAHVEGSTWWAIHEGGAYALVECRPDLDETDIDECAKALEERRS